jgi:hypothetical protein
MGDRSLARPLPTYTGQHSTEKRWHKSMYRARYDPSVRVVQEHMRSRSRGHCDVIEIWNEWDRAINLCPVSGIGVTIFCSPSPLGIRCHELQLYILHAVTNDINFRSVHSSVLYLSNSRAETIHQLQRITFAVKLRMSMITFHSM